MPSPTTTKTKNSKPLFSPGHRSCAGCGQALSAKLVIEALGPETILVNATGCLEVTTTPYPESAWGVPWIHSLFENAAAVASGVQAALRKQGRADRIKVAAQGGDGSTFDIGFGLISGMWERGDRIIYICYDNEAYSNTGFQASGATMSGTETSTTPIGQLQEAELGAVQRKKDMIAIALAHGLKYVAQTTTGYPNDIQAKLKAAAETDGPSYVQILAPCVPGWGIKPSDAIKVGRLAAETGLYPGIEYRNGVLTGRIKVPNPKPAVEEYLKLQKRFSHLFKKPSGQALITAIQAQADQNIARYQL